MLSNSRCPIRIVRTGPLATNEAMRGVCVMSDISPGYGYSGIVGNVFQDVLTTGQIPNATEPTLCCLSTTTVTWSGGSMFAVGGLWNTAPVNEGGKINIVLNWQAELSGQAK
jgi:hypothetical protein